MRTAVPRPLEVLMCSDTEGFGGAELHMVDLAAALLGSRFSPAVLVHPGRTDPRMVELVERRGVPLVSAPCPAGKLEAGALLGLRRALAERRRQCRGRLLVHCHQWTPYTNHLLLAVAWSLGIPTVCTEHGYYPPTDRAMRLRRSLINAFVKQDIAVSRAVAHAIITDLGQSADKVVTIINGVHPPALGTAGRAARARGRSALRAALGVPAGARVVGTVGRQSPEKNLPGLVRAMGPLAREYPDLVVLLAGEGEEEGRRSMQSAADSAGWGGRLLLPGRVEDLGSLLASLDVFVLPSLTEGMPLSLQEAMAMEVPVVATAVGGVPELITHGVDGLLVDDPTDTAGLSAAVGRLLADPPLGRLLAKRGSRTVRTRFGFERMVARTMQVYDHATRTKGM